MLITLFTLGIATGTASFTLTKSKVFASLRSWIAAKNKWLGDLFGCPYCMSHWLAAIAMAIYRPRFLHTFWIADYGVAWLFMVFLATLTFWMIVSAIYALTPAVTVSTSPENSRYAPGGHVPVPRSTRTGTTAPIE